MKLVESFLTKNPCYTAGRKITVKGLMLHSVGCPQPKAMAFINNWNSPSYSAACVHGFIDGNDGTVYQTLPWDHRGWHCGGAANNTHIGVEMCEPSCISYTGGASFTCSDLATARASATKTYEAAVDLFAMLCSRFSLDPLSDGVIISHREGHSRGVASNHGDPEHLWTQLGMAYTMNTFRQAVKEKLNGNTAETPAAAATDSERMIWDALMGKIGNPYGVAGLMGNLYAESGLKPNNLQNSFERSLGYTDESYTAAVDDGTYKGFVHDSAGYGLAQWTYYSRKQALLEYVKAAGKSIGDLTAQIGFLCRELAENYRSVFKILQEASSVLDASNAVLTQYERPADQSASMQKKRAGFGQVYFDRFAASVTTETASKRLYRVRKSWTDSKSQLGAYHVLESAKKTADENPGYTVYDEAGKALYTSAVQDAPAAPFTVKVRISDLNIRRGPGTNYAATGRHTGIGVFTIVEVKDGAGSVSGWGRLKSGTGWISLDYAAKI